MKFCNECKLKPICIYSENDYELPDVFDIRCKFQEKNPEPELPGQIMIEEIIKEYQELPFSEELETENSENAQNDAEYQQECENPGQNADEKESNTEESKETKIAEAVSEMMDDLDDESLQKYPAKKAAKPISAEKRAEVMKLYEKMKPDQIAKQLGIGKTSVYRIIKEELGMK